MSFFADLIDWFRHGSTPEKNDSISPVVSDVQTEPAHPVPPQPSPIEDLDLEPSLTSKDIMGDLRSIQSLTKQFDAARQELITELQKLAPPKKRNPFWDKKDAA
jgi:hypothetical protein